MQRTVTNPTQLSATIAAAQAGDEILLDGLNFGKLALSGKKGLTFRPHDPSPGTVQPSFSEVDVLNSSDILFQGISVDFPTDAATQDFTPAVLFRSSQNCQWSGGAISGHLMPAGTAHAGFPYGRGVWADRCRGIEVDGIRFTGFKYPTFANATAGITVQGNSFTNFGDCIFAGGGDQQIAILNNFAQAPNPWHWGQPGGDHGDFIHIYTAVGQAVPCADITIVGNTFLERTGAPIMGISLQDRSALHPGFKNVRIEENLISTGNDQAFRLEHLDGFTVLNNTAVSVATKIAKDTICILAGCRNGKIDRNIFGAAIYGAEAGNLPAMQVTVGQNLILPYAKLIGVLPNPAGAQRSDFVAIPGGPGAGYGIH